MPQLTQGDGKMIFQPIFLDSDHLTKERARNVQWVFQDGDDQFDRLEGLDPTHADWHAKVNLYKVEICYSPFKLLLDILSSLSSSDASFTHKMREAILSGILNKTNGRSV